MGCSRSARQFELELFTGTLKRGRAQIVARRKFHECADNSDHRSQSPRTDATPAAARFILSALSALAATSAHEFSVTR